MGEVEEIVTINTWGRSASAINCDLLVFVWEGRPVDIWVHDRLAQRRAVPAMGWR
jgi:hypothetical protein